MIHQLMVKRVKLPLPAVFKAVVSIGLLVLIFFKIPFLSLKYPLMNCNWQLLVLSLILVNLCMVVSVYKWRPLLTIHCIEIPFLSLLKYYYAGLFANNFLPSSIGGDALRIYDVARVSGKLKEAAASVIMERLLAALALALTAAAALLFVSRIEGSVFIYKIVGALLVICLAVIIVLLSCNFGQNSRLGQWLASLKNYKDYPLELVKVLLLSFVFQFTLVVANVFIFQSLGVDLALTKHFLYIPVIMAVSMLPLSVNGIGVREGMYVMLYGYAGVEEAVALAGSLLFFTFITVSSLAGGVIIALRK